MTADYQEIRRRIEGRYRRQVLFGLHLSAFLFLFVVLGWGVGLLIHYLDYYYEAGGGAERRERAIHQAIEREVALRRGEVYDDKPKRDPHIHLTEDGELEEVNADADGYYTQEPKGSQR